MRGRHTTMAESESLATKREQLLAACWPATAAVRWHFRAGWIAPSCAKAAQLALGDGAVAVTGTSDALAAGELEAASELGDSDWHAARRHCRPTSSPIRTTWPTTRIDVTTAKPNFIRSWATDTRAARRERRRQRRQCGRSAATIAPECGPRTSTRSAARSPNAVFTKQEVRELAAAWELPVADKPATPVPIEPRGLRSGGDARAAGEDRRAEQFLRSLGLRELRVRLSRRRHGPHRSARRTKSPSCANQRSRARWSRSSNDSASSSSRSIWPASAPAASRNWCQAKCCGGFRNPGSIGTGGPPITSASRPGVSSQALKHRLPTSTEPVMTWSPRICTGRPKSFLAALFLQLSNKST